MGCVQIVLAPEGRRERVLPARALTATHGSVAAKTISNSPITFGLDEKGPPSGRASRPSGRRGADKRIIEAYGFDLSPLAIRYEEFVRLAAEAQIERTRAKALGKRKTIARRAVYQAGETLASVGPMPEGWSELVMKTARLTRLPAGTSEELAFA
jgi:Replication protein C N-terminal domain